ncbi:MAG: M15 family metallopeptidase [Clostridia bacterium]|nr:M15 family metallopeptidase [Clostridia bacterium]
MKRIVCIILTVVTLAALAACGARNKSIDYLVLVNKENKLPDDWEEKLETVTVKNSLGDDVEVEKEAYGAYLKLKDALAAEDVRVDLDSARRSVAEQQRIWDDFMEKYGETYTKRTVAVPGYSEHHTGLALDLYLNIDGEDVYYNEDMVEYPEVWEKIHAKLAEYGFILRYLEGKEAITGYGYEPWHIRYVGSAEIAKEIADRGVTFEEYLGRLPEGDVAPPKD